MYVLKTETVGPYTVKMSYDECGDWSNPRKCDNLGVFYTACQYISPDEPPSEYGDIMDWIAGDLGVNDFCPPWDEMDEKQQTALENRIHKKAIIFPVYIYDHSGVAYSVHPFSCPWDSGQVGYIYSEKSKVRAEYGVKRISSKIREKVEKNFSSEVSEFSSWAEGDVYKFTIEREGDVVECCGGFIGDDDGCWEEAMSLAKAICGSEGIGP